MHLPRVSGALPISRVASVARSALIGRRAGLNGWANASGSSQPHLGGRTGVRRGCSANAAAAPGGGQSTGEVSNEDDGRYAGAARDQGQPPRICVVGGGFGGLYTAIKLEQLMWPKGSKPRVTLVDQNTRFSFKPLLYDVLTDSATEEEVAPAYSTVLAPYSVRYVQGKMTGVNKDEDAEKAVLLQDGGRVPYDWLVMAVGARTNSFGVPGVEEYALQFSTYEDAVRLKEELAKFGVDEQNRNKFPEICVVGGGYAGVELAASLVDRLGGKCKVRLVTSGDDIMEQAPEGQREAAREVLRADSVSMMCGRLVEEIKVAGGASGGETGTGKRIIQTTDKASKSRKETIEADIVIWTAGQSPALGREQRDRMPFKVNEYGAMETDRTLKVVNTRDVFALGDVAIGSQQTLPSTAQVALQQADFVAWNIWASINNRPLLNFQYQHLGNMMSLGASKGAVALPIPVPPPISAALKASPFGDILKAVGVSVNTTFGGASDGITIQGPAGALLRRAAYLYRQPTDGQRLSVVSSWGSLVQDRVKRGEFK
jgi:NADH:ubiquinone reductase (non-electrogenic)